jgi:carbamoyl-phosphate synthase large subunit
VPRRDDLQSVLIIGSGPIVIGQACEFDYSGTQACRVLRREGYRVVLVNSNPATIMTDPEFADATYVEPLDVETLTRVIDRERPDALLPTLGGQTALNLAIALEERGILAQYGVELSRRQRRGDPHRRGPLALQGRDAGDRPRRAPLGPRVRGRRGAAVAESVGYPVIVRPSFILGGGGTGFARDRDEMVEVATKGLAAAPRRSRSTRSRRRRSSSSSRCSGGRSTSSR